MASSTIQLYKHLKHFKDGDLFPAIIARKATLCWLSTVSVAKYNFQFELMLLPRLQRTVHSIEKLNTFISICDYCFANAISEM